MSGARSRVAAALLICVCPAAAAQAQTEDVPPPSGPLALRLPATPRTASLGNAWVAGRDQDVLFYNPAQLVGARTGFDVSLFRFSGQASGVTLGSIYAAGRMSLTLGWGVQLINTQPAETDASPWSPDVVLRSGAASAHSTLAMVGGAIVYKGFRLGAAGKYVVDRVQVAAGAASPRAADGVLLADIGVARNLFGGVAAFSAQNLGRRHLFPPPDATSDDDGEDDEEAPSTVPRQLLMGWSITKVTGPLDLALFSQVLVREGWTSVGSGIEASYSWIDGCIVALRAGASRPESQAQRPYALGGALTIDRLTVEYSMQFFDERRLAHGVTLRWR